MICRDEVLAAMLRLCNRHDRDVFSLSEIVHETLATSSRYRESTIRTHVTAHMCKQNPHHCGSCYDDLDRVGYGLYELRSG
jgi:hypothetical protein|tara:strand:- start:367 stop:609 length:243 start_codon:yes stop_codon:yes gene_type:complete